MITVFRFSNQPGAESENTSRSSNKNYSPNNIWRKFRRQNRKARSNS